MICGYQAPLETEDQTPFLKPETVRTTASGEYVDEETLLREEDAAQLKLQLTQRLQVMRQKEEEIQQNLQSIIDAAVSRQTAPSQESGEQLSPPTVGTDSFKETGEVDTDASASPDVSEVVCVFESTEDTEGEDLHYAIMDSEVGDATDDTEDASIAETDAGKDEESCADDDSEGRLIFISRTFSGVVDLFLPAIFSGIILGIAEYSTDAPMLSSLTMINFSALFLMIYFLYSIFFLMTNGQTIGMMAAELRVTAMNGNPLSMSQVVRRNAMFLISLFGLGIGLVTGLFSRECLCLHDRLSGTYMIRTFKQADITDI